MYKHILFILLLVAGTIGNAQEKINDPNAVQRTVTAFNQVKVSNAFDVYLVQGNEDGLVVSASEAAFIDKIKTYVQNNVLHIEVDKDKNFWKGWSHNKANLKAYISFKNLEKLDVSGACNIIIKGTLNAEKLAVHLSGASDMKGKINVNELVVHLNGASDINITGIAKNATIDASGASEFKGYDLHIDNCSVDASGASAVRITVNKELSVKASGASDIGYKGDGVMREVKTSGASHVSRKS